MRCAMVFAAVLIAGCAHLAPGEARMRVDVAEMRGDYRSVSPYFGPHVFTISVENLSHDPFTVNTIELRLTGIPFGTIEDPAQYVQTPVNPGTTERFEIAVNVIPTGVGGNQAIPPFIDAVQLIIGCANEAGSFVEQGQYTVSHLRSGMGGYAARTPNLSATSAMALIARSR